MNSFEATLGPKKRLMQKTLEPILDAAGLCTPDMREIVITENAIREFSTYDGLTSAILNHDMPEIVGAKVLDHFTNFSGFKGIVDSQELRLAPVTLRLHEGELAAFAFEHELLGFVDPGGAPKQLLKDAAADLFYMSFSNPTASDHLWDVFGDRGNGCRFRFEVTSGGASQMRAIRYHDGTTLLKQVNTALTSVGLPRFILKGVSRVGAFYLPMTWKAEDEIRLLVKRFPGGGAPVTKNGGREYWPIPVGATNPTATLKLLEIGVRNLDAAKISSKLPAWCASVPVVTD